MPYFSNKEIKEAPRGYVPASISEAGTVIAPQCCKQKMKYVGDCDMGCCDDYRCEKCSYKVRIEWPD